jgi:hypothetical protein
VLHTKPFYQQRQVAYEIGGGVQRVKLILEPGEVPAAPTTHKPESPQPTINQETRFSQSKLTIEPWRANLWQPSSLSGQLALCRFSSQP